MAYKVQSGDNPFPQNRSTSKGADAQQFYFSIFRSAGLIHWIGYGLLLFVGIDLAAIFYPPRFGDPAWHFRTLGQLVERVPVPLLGLILVFFGERKPRLKWEFPVLMLLSWLTFLFGLFFLLIVPLGIVETVQLERLSQQQVDLSSDQQIAQIQAVEKQVQQATTSPNLLSIARRYSLDELDLQTAPTIGTEPLRKQITAALAQRQRVIISDGEAQKERQWNRLLKRSVKWNLGAAISSVLLFGLWRGTGWAR